MRNWNINVYNVLGRFSMKLFHFLALVSALFTLVFLKLIEKIPRWHRINVALCFGKTKKSWLIIKYIDKTSFICTNLLELKPFFDLTNSQSNYKTNYIKKILKRWWTSSFTNYSSIFLRTLTRNFKQNRNAQNLQNVWKVCFQSTYNFGFFCDEPLVMDKH